jgi:hypothetical protein
VVGGPVSVPDARLSEIEAHVGATSIIDIDRLVSAGDRYDLARAIANRMKSVADATMGKELAGGLLFANGADSTKFFDALALSPIAAANGAPVLLVTYDSVPSATTKAIADMGSPSTRIVGGGPATVSESVRSQLGATRWSGADRYSTATKIANEAVANGWLARQDVAIAAKLPDALTGGAVVGREGGVLLLTQSDVLTSTTKSWLMTYRNEVYRCSVLGGTVSVTPAVMSAVEKALE